MSSLYAATEFGSDLQSLGFLGNRTFPKPRLSALKQGLGFELPRIGRWLLRIATERDLSRAELTGWILPGDYKPEPAGLPTLLNTSATPGPDALPSALYGGLLRIGQTPNAGYWGADLHKKTMPVFIYEPTPESIRAGWRRRFDKLDDFLFFAAKAALCQRDRITLDEYLELARERNVRPEELVPDALEDEREVLVRMGLRRPKKLPVVSNRFIWADVLLARVLGYTPSPDEVARIWVDIFRLHVIREDRDDFSDPSVVAFWLLRHALFGDTAGYDRVLRRAPSSATPLARRADAEARRWWDKKTAPFDRVAVARAIEQRSSRR